jgi:hypothetical protein
MTILNYGPPVALRVALWGSVTSGWESRDLPMVGCHITRSSPLQTSTFPRHWPARLLLWAQLRRVLVPSQDVSRVEKSIHSAEYGLDIRC